MDELEHICGICRHCITKRRFFGGERYYCNVQNVEVGWEDQCKSYQVDLQKVADIARYRRRTKADRDKGCDQCKFFDARYDASKKVVKRCKRLCASLDQGDNPMDMVCDYFVDGGLEALANGLFVVMSNQDHEE